MHVNELKSERQTNLSVEYRDTDLGRNHKKNSVKIHEYDTEKAFAITSMKYTF